MLGRKWVGNEVDADNGLIPEHIEILTRWVGFADPPSRVAKLSIARQGPVFVRRLELDGETDQLPQDCVMRLLEALSWPRVPELDVRLFDQSEGIQRHYGSMWTDDCPAHLVKVVFADGRIVTIRSESQHAWMLPMTISDSLHELDGVTFDPRLSRAIAALMPDEYLEKDRLNGRCGELEWDTEECRRESEGAGSVVIGNHPSLDASDDAGASTTLDTVRDEICRILRREESPAEIAAAEQLGRLSERLLKRVSLQDAQSLLARGANPGIADEHGQTALMLAASPPLDRDMFRLLVQSGADVDARRNDGFSGLHLACSGGMDDAAQEWVRAGADVQARGPGEATPLMLAATWPAIVRLLLAAGADVNAVDQDGHSALAYAILRQSWVKPSRQRDAMRTMVAAGADVNIRDREGITPLGHAQRVLRRVELEEEVVRAFQPDAGRSRGPGACELEMRMARSIVELMMAAGGR